MQTFTFSSGPYKGSQLRMTPDRRYVNIADVLTTLAPRNYSAQWIWQQIPKNIFGDRELPGHYFEGTTLGGSPDRESKTEK